MKILVTAFNAFGGGLINPTAQALECLPATINGAEIITLELPTEFGASLEAVTSKLDEEHFDAVLSLGQAGGRPALTPERVAINVDDAVIADNAGDIPIDTPIVSDAPAAYFSTAPIKGIIAAIRDIELPAYLSNSAGTFVCNHVMYGVLHHLATTGRAHIPAGFLHVPFIPNQVRDKPTQPSMTLEDIVRGINATLEVMIDFAQQGAGAEDLHVAEGGVC